MDNVMTIEHWVLFQMLIDMALVGLVLYLMRNFKSGIQEDASKQAAGQVISLLEPLLKEAQATAQTFESQLKEKQRLILDLNQRLDSRIIGLNLLLNRSEAYLDGGVGNSDRSAAHVYDQQEGILDLFNRGQSAQEIADTLGMPKGEVDLVLDLKRKFSMMEHCLNAPAAG